MKKYLFWGGLFLLGLMAACTETEQLPEGGEVGNLVTLTVQREADPVTRAEPAIPDGYKLRYILEIRDKAEQDIRPMQRYEQENGTFEFTLAKGSYDFLLWADYVDELDTDKYYDTQDLTEVSRIADPATLSDSEALDAFFGSLEVKKTSDPLTIELVTLTRPFARINLIEKQGSSLSAVKAIEVTYTKTEGTTFNVADGTVTEGEPAEEPTTLTFTEAGTFASVSGGLFFTDFWWVDADVRAVTTTAIGLRFFGDVDKTELLSSDAGAVGTGQPYRRNYVTSLTKTFVAANGVLEVDYDSEYQVPTEAERTIAILEKARVRADEESAIMNTFYLDTSEELFALAYAVNNGLTMPTNIVAAEHPYAAAFYGLDTDIDLKDEPWRPIGDSEDHPFTGRFYGVGKNGNFYQIIGLNVEHASYAAGLFGYVTGEICFLQVEGKIRTEDEIAYAGGIVGVYENAYMLYCSFSGTVETAATVAAGGLVGVASSGSRMGVSVGLATTVTASGGAQVGPLIGLWDNTSGYVRDHNVWLSEMTTNLDEGGNKGYGTLAELLTEGVSLLNEYRFVLSVFTGDYTIDVYMLWANVGGELKIVAEE
ncbi:MAG: hypothetical protein LBM61_05040 [Prevotellaceae bacterium]|jgi:hypothetical protein|nr:hypothetical protein [Prevotellaceae bacterium]